MFTVTNSPSSPEVRSGYSVSGLRYSVKSSLGGYYSDSPIYPGTNQGEFSGGTGCLTRLNTYPAIPTFMRNEAVTKALLSISDQKAGIGEDLATYRQTVGLLHNPASALLRALKSLKDNRSMIPFYRVSFREAVRNGVDRTLAQRYLEYVYGMKPLMSDIFGVVDLLKKQGVKPLFIVGKGSAHQSAQCAPKTFSSGATVVTVDEQAVVRCKLWSRIDPNHAGLRAVNQLGLLNPASLIWELVPWSFVIDWFVPIGPVLQALSAPAGLIFVDGSISSKVVARGNYTHNDLSYPNSAVSSESLGTGDYHYRGYSRSPIRSWPLPGFWYNQDPLSGDRPLKALALAITRLRS